MPEKTFSQENSGKIEKSGFLTLFQKIWEHFQQVNNINSRELFGGNSAPRTRFYPTEKEKSASVTLADDMLRHPDVAGYLSTNHWPPESFNGKKLYEFRRNAESERTDWIKVSASYLQVYCLYLNCSNWEEFRRKYVQRHTEYDGYHYSAREHKVVTFDFNVDFTAEPYQAFVQRYWLKDVNRRYFGEGKFMKDGLFFALTDDIHGYFYMVLHLPDRRNLQSAFMTGRVLTASSDGNPISSEVILVRKDAGWSDKKQDLRIRQYLFLKRPTQHIRNQEYGGDIENLNIRGVKPSRFEILTGCYRVWYYGGKRKFILQQRFVVTEEYGAWLERRTRHSNSLENLDCRLTLNDQPSPRVLAAIHRKGIENPIGYTILQNLRPGDEFKSGVHINVSYENRPLARYALILRYEPEDNGTRAFEPDAFQIDSADFQALLEQNPALQKMKEQLDYLEFGPYQS